MADLKTNYKDDVLNTSKNTKRKYQMTTNADGTVSFTDVTDYSQEGDSFGAADINGITSNVNNLNNSILDSMSAINSNTEEGKIAGALAVKELNNNLTSIETYSTDEKIVGKWVDGRNVYQKTYQGVMPTPTTMGSRFSYDKVLETFSGNVFPIASDGYFYDGACYTVGSSTSYQSSSFYDSCVASSNNILSFTVSTPYNTTITYAVTVKYLKES